MTPRRDVPELPTGTRLRRHPALAPLSRDHHHALVQSLRLREGEQRALPAARDIGRSFLEHWEREMLGHFEDEEQVLFTRAGFADPEAVLRVRAEHDELRALVSRLRQALAAGGDPRPWMRQIGELVRDHVRYEERAWFEHVQQRLPEQELEQLGRELAARRATRGGGPACQR